MSSQGFRAINEDDLTFFAKTLAFLDISDNLLGGSNIKDDDTNDELAKLKTLNALQELNLSSNNIKSLKFISSKTSRWSESQ